MKAPQTLDRRALLASVDIFAGLEETTLTELLGMTHVRTLQAGETLLRKDSRGDQLYAVMAGCLKACVVGDGKEMVFNLMGPGEVIGEISLLHSGICSASVIAMEQSELLSLHRRDFLPFLERNPRIAIQLAQFLAARFRRLSEQVEDNHFLGLSSRLAKKLMGLAGAYGKATPEGVLVDLHLSQATLGELVGASRESINKQLRAWADAGLVHWEKGHVTIIDRETLGNIAGLLIQ